MASLKVPARSTVESNLTAFYRIASCKIEQENYTMSEKYRFFTLAGRQYPIVKTDSGQLVVKLTPQQWDQLDADQQEVIVQVDNLLAREWAGGAIYYQKGKPPGRIWEV
jgi:hypothetical protein